jgi:hypothetical protein
VADDLEIGLERTDPASQSLAVSIEFLEHGHRYAVARRHPLLQVEAVGRFHCSIDSAVFAGRTYE